MLMSEVELNRKKKVRAAHWAAVTKVIVQLKGLCHEECLDKLRLSQKSALLAKCETIKKLDEEIVEEVPEEELEPEIGWADVVQEQIKLAIMEADGIL